jgi:hypothetical protein
MRCNYKQAACPGIPPETICFECEYCAKKIVVAPALVSRIEQITQSFPDCPKPPNTGAISAGVPPLIATTPGAALALPAPSPPPLPPPVPYKWDPAGAGTQLKKLLAKVGITSTENCSCNARARIMNDNGIEWCEQNTNEIVGWLKEEAGRRKLPFLSFPTKILVQRAVKIAKKIRDSQVPEAAAEAAVEAESSSAA